MEQKTDTLTPLQAAKFHVLMCESEIYRLKKLLVSAEVDLKVAQIRVADLEASE